jgi:hypothetical protein
MIVGESTETGGESLKVSCVRAKFNRFASVAYYQRSRVIRLSRVLLGCRTWGILLPSSKRIVSRCNFVQDVRSLIAARG